jgi:hypothetical protein
MTTRDDTPKPTLTPKTAEARANRERRLADALRANLKRRKEQSRGRTEDAEPKKSEQETGRRGEE